MRDSFTARLEDLAATDPRIFLITGDLGFGVLDKFEKRFPKQYLNAGVAEQNMTDVATGIAMEGRIVWQRVTAPGTSTSRHRSSFRPQGTSFSSLICVTSRSASNRCERRLRHLHTPRRDSIPRGHDLKVNWLWDTAWTITINLNATQICR